MDEQKIKSTLAKNIAYYRKGKNLTQSELAEKIAYSDKAVSKWERGEGLPDILVMMKLCEIFSISLNDLVSEKQKRIKTSFLRNKIIITILAVLLAWLVAVISFVILNLTLPDPSYTWLSFIYALPVTGIILIVFTAIWGNKWFVCGSISFLIWMVCLGISLPLRFFAPSTNDALVFYIGLPFQVLCILFFLLKNKKKDI